MSGQIIEQSGRPDTGMVLDFSEVKRLAREHVVDCWDHAFLVYREDRPVIDFLASLPGHKTVVLESIPTAENLARIAFTILNPVYRGIFENQLRLERIRIYETPNCWADYSVDDVALEQRNGR